MALTIYQAAVPTCIRALSNLIAILDKGAAHAAARKIEQSVLINTRLYPDMLPLCSQVTIACASARDGAARLAGAEVTAFEMGKASFEELADGVRWSITFLESLKPAQFEGAEDRTITWSTRTTTNVLPATAYLFNHMLPNMYFHVTTAYDILRQAGVEIGKRDYLGKN